jgi:hypothetical protein
MQYSPQSPNLESESKGKVAQTAEQAQQKAKEITQQAQEQAKSAAASRKEQAAEGLQGIAQAFRQTGETLRQENQGAIADYSEKMASQIERFSSYLEERDVDQLLGDAEGFARRHPEAFLGGAFAFGLLLGRFIKSSGERRELVRAGYYHPSSYPPAPRPATWEETSTFEENDVRGTQPSYRPQVNNPDFP